MPDGENKLHATRRGNTLNQQEVDMLTRVLDEALAGAWPAFQTFNIPCFVQHTENNDGERAKRQCPYCKPLMDI